MNELNWKIRSMVPEDEKQILKLFKICFGNELSSEHWNWQFLQNPFSKHIVWIAETSKGEIVGHYSIIPVPFWRKNNVEKAGYSIYSMINPEYQRQGMLKALAAAGDKQLAEDDIKIGVTYLNENSFPVYTNSLGWTTIEGNLPVYWSILSPYYALKHITKSKYLALLGSWFIAPTLYPFFHSCKTTCHEKPIRVTKFDPEITGLWEKVRSHVQFSINRDAEYLNWRFAANPRNYDMWITREGNEITGLLVTRVDEKFGQRFGYIAELLFDPAHPEIGLQLINHAREEFKSSGCGIATSLALEPECYRSVLQRGGFRLLPKKLMPHGMFFCVREQSSRNELKQLTNRNNWFVSWSDHDVV